MALLLAIDTVDTFCSVALAGKGGKILSAIHEDIGRGHAERLVPMIAEALEAANAKPKDISRIVLTTGPGTFAGVRVGVAAARALALANGAEVLGLTSFEALAGFAAMKKAWRAAEQLAAVMPGRGCEIAVELFHHKSHTAPPWEKVKGPRSLQPADLAAWAGAARLAVAGPGHALAAVPASPALKLSPGWPQAADLVAISALFPKQRWGKTATPNYVRSADARPQGLPPSSHA